MKIDGVTYDNPNYGYTTTVDFPFTFCDNGDDTVSTFDAGDIYDRYSCKCSMVFYDTDTYSDFVKNFTRSSGLRGQLITLTECDSTGFFPFGYFVTEPVAGYSCIMSDVKTEDKQDITGKFYKVEFTLSWIYEESRSIRPQSINLEQDGSLTFASVSGLPYPEDGFIKEKAFDQKLNYMMGGYQYGLDINNGDDDRIDVEFTLILTDKQVNNLLQKIIVTYRGGDIPVTAPESYSVCGVERLPDVSYNLKLIDKRLKIKHISHNQFGVSFKMSGR